MNKTRKPYTSVPLPAVSILLNALGDIANHVDAWDISRYQKTAQAALDAYDDYLWPVDTEQPPAIPEPLTPTLAQRVEALEKAHRISNRKIATLHQSQRDNHQFQDRADRAVGKLIDRITQLEQRMAALERDYAGPV